MLMYSPYCALSPLRVKGGGHVGYTYTDIGVGLSTLLVPTDWAMREPL